MTASKRMAVNRRSLWWAPLGGCLLALAAVDGCVDTEKTLKEAAERRKMEDEIASLRRDVASRDDMIRTQAAQIQELRGIGPDRARLIPHADRIEIDPLSGTYDDDRNGVPDGMVVYFKAFDADGDVIKAAGTATVQALDLAAGPEGQSLAECKLDEVALRKAWYGQFMTSHFTVKCPWRSGPPARGDVTIRVRFVDLVTGKPFEAVKQAKVVSASTRPATP